jgi:hypothetical protein
VDIYQNFECFLDIYLNFLCVILGSQLLGATGMKKHNHSTKKSQQNSIWSTARHAVVHVMVFSIISVTGHVATTGISASVGAIGKSIAAPIGGMYLM